MTTETTAPLTASLPSGLAGVTDEIVRAAKEARRDPASVTLIAVSKTFDADAIAPVIAAGQRAFGENRVQEAKAKWPALKGRHPGIALHLIGPLQSNKAREAVALPWTGLCLVEIATPDVDDVAPTDAHRQRGAQFEITREIGGECVLYRGKSTVATTLDHDIHRRPPGRTVVHKVARRSRPTG